MNAKNRRHERRKLAAISKESDKRLSRKIVVNMAGCSERATKALALPSLRERQLETIKLPRRKQFNNATAWGKQKIRSGEKPLVWG